MQGRSNVIVAFIRALPSWAEFAIVVSAAFGAFIAQSLAVAFEVPDAFATSAWDFANLAIQETAVAAALGWFLAVRGWRFADLGLDRPNARDVGQALLLLAAAFAATTALWYFLPAETRERMAFGGFAFDGGSIGLPLALGVSLVNALFEEVFVCAYVLSAWRGSSMWNAITASAAIRLAYHLYQGPLAIVTVGPLGLIFAWFYATRGRLWPLVAAHALADVVFLLPYVRL